MRFRSQFPFRSRNAKIALIRQLCSISRLSRHENADRPTPKPFQRGQFVAVRPHFESMVTMQVGDRFLKVLEHPNSLLVLNKFGSDILIKL